jgi:hypothetical protein
MSFHYASTVTGSAGTLSYSWVFTDASGAQVATSSSASGDISVAAGGQYTGHLTVTDARATGNCPATSSSSTTVNTPVSASPTLTTRCDGGLGYSAGAVSPSGSSCTWTFTSGSSTYGPISDPTCSGGTLYAQAGTTNPLPAGSYTATVSVSASATAGGCAASFSSAAGTVNAILRPSAFLSWSCTQTPSLSFHYSSGVTGNIGATTYSWVFTDSTGAQVGTSSSPSGDFPVAGSGAYTGTLTITDSRSCPATATSHATVYPSITVSPSLTGGCQSQFSYDATVTGGSGLFTYQWSFNDPLNTTSTTKSGGPISTGALATGGGTFTGKLTATDTATGCTASNSASTHVYSPIAVAITPSAAGASCPSIATDQVTYSSTVTGGSGSFSYAWNGSGVAACSGTSCLINPNGAFFYSASFTLTVSDAPASQCTAATSAPGNYSKVTTVTAN